MPAPTSTQRPDSARPGAPSPGRAPASPGRAGRGPRVQRQGPYADQQAQVRPGGGGAGYGGQREAAKPPTPGLPQKKASGKAMARLGKARDGIAHAKTVFKYGAGNQYSALKESRFNSYFRLKVMRDLKYWDLAPSVRPLAAANREALTAAMADLAAGGNCGEHAAVGYDYLRVAAPGQTISKVSVKGLDHAFVLMGDVQKDSDADLVVCDPWPSAATACLWEDHFAFGFNSDRAAIQVAASMQADGQNVKAVIAAGLKLNALGEATIKAQMSSEETDKTLEEGTKGDHPWIWQHPDAAGQGKKFAYVADAKQPAPQDHKKPAPKPG